MLQDQLINALANHLDFLESLVNWAIIAAIAAGWAGIQRSPHISVVGVSFDRKYAFIAVSIVFIALQLAVFIGFLRITALIHLLQPSSSNKGLTILATHKWLLNPYAYFGLGMPERFVSSSGYGLLIVVWWLCNSALFSLLDDRNKVLFRCMLAIFLLIGLLTMGAIQFGLIAVLKKLEYVPVTFREGILGTFIERSLFAYIGIGIGLAVFNVVIRLHRKIRSDEPSIFEARNK